MLLKHFTHAGLRRLYWHDDARAVPPAAADKLRTMLIALHVAPDLAALQTLPTWKLHPLKGSRKGAWAFHVTKNWRLTFTVTGATLTEINLEDYH